MNNETMILEGIKVLDVASFIAGPVATTVMAVSYTHLRAHETLR